MSNIIVRKLLAGLIALLVTVSQGIAVGHSIGTLALDRVAVGAYHAGSMTDAARRI